MSKSLFSESTIRESIYSNNNNNDGYLPPEDFHKAVDIINNQKIEAPRRYISARDYRYAEKETIKRKIRNHNEPMTEYHMTELFYQIIDERLLMEES